MKAKEVNRRFFRIFIGEGSSKFFVNRKVKDRLFRYIFSKDKEALLELYNALHKTSYTNPDDLEIVTVDSVVYMSMKNDVAFMLYGLIRLPTPQCVVFYNGEKDMPEEQLLRLSDAFENKEQVSSVELTVRMININFGHNQELMNKCRKLYEYSYFIDQIRQNTDRGMKLKEAVGKAVNHCLEEDILTDILEVHRMEVVGMLINEFNERKHWKLVTRAAKKEGYEEGCEKGKAFGRAEGEYKKLISQICRKLEKGKSLELIAEEVEEPLEKVMCICDTAAKYAPGYDVDLIYEHLLQRK